MADHAPTGSRRRLGRAYVALLLATVVLSACGGGGEGEGEGSLEPTASLTRSPEGSVTASVPSPTRTSASRTRTPQPSEQPTATATVAESAGPRPTRTATETATRTATQTATQTATVTATPTPTEIPSETPAAEPSETPSPAAGTPKDSSGVPSWAWWLLAALLVAATVAVPLVLRSRRRAAWQTELAAAEDEVAWFARTLLPELRAARTGEAIGGGWRVSEERVVRAEDRLTTLVGSGPDPQSDDRAVTLRDAVRQARTRIRGLVDSQAPDGTAELDAVIADLEAVLVPRPPTAPATG